MPVWVWLYAFSMSVYESDPSCMSVCVLPHTAVGIVGYMQGDWDGTGALSPQGGHYFLGLSLTAWSLHPRTAQVRELTELHALLLLHHRTTHSSYRSFWKHTTYIRLNITVVYSFFSALQNKTMNMFLRFSFGGFFTLKHMFRWHSSLSDFTPTCGLHVWYVFVLCIIESISGFPDAVHYSSSSPLFSQFSTGCGSSQELTNGANRGWASCSHG